MLPYLIASVNCASVRIMITLIVTLAIAGVIVYVLNAILPIDGRFKLAINCIIGIALCLYLLSYFGIWDASRHSLR